MTPWGLVNCKVFGLQGPSLTNRVSELFTHGSVGGVGRKPGPYPAPPPVSKPGLSHSPRVKPSTPGPPTLLTGTDAPTITGM